MDKKVTLDAEAHAEKIQHAPLSNARIIYRELGRENIDSLVMLHCNEDTKHRYARLVCNKNIKNCPGSPLTKVCMQRGIVGEMCDLINVLQEREEDVGLLKNTLQLVECFHLAYFCKEDYAIHSCDIHKWLVSYVVDAVTNCSLNRIDFNSAVARAGDQMTHLLSNITLLVQKSESEKALHQQVQVWHTKHKENGNLCLSNAPFMLGYEAFASKRRSKVQIRNVLTT